NFGKNFLREFRGGNAFGALTEIGQMNVRHRNGCGQSASAFHTDVHFRAGNDEVIHLELLGKGNIVQNSAQVVAVQAAFVIDVGRLHADGLDDDLVGKAR